VAEESGNIKKIFIISREEVRDFWREVRGL
jgi:hypothetical protein